MFRNEWDVKELVDRVGDRGYAEPELARYASYLLQWVNIVNTHTDGWAYWSAGSKAGNKLAQLIEDKLNGKTIADAEWSRAIGGIKSTAKRQLKYGNSIPVPSLG